MVECDTRNCVGDGDPFYPGFFRVITVTKREESTQNLLLQEAMPRHLVDKLTSRATCDWPYQSLKSL